MTLFQGTEQFITLRDWLRYFVSLFGEHKLSMGQGRMHAYDEASYLLLHALHLPMEPMEPMLDAQLTLKEITTIKEIIFQRVINHEPAAYISKEAWLGGLSFHVDPRVIIPRSYFVDLIPQAIEPWIENIDVTNILDLCTGSGCLAILLAKIFTHAQVDAVELSQDAYDVAKINVSRYKLESRVNIHLGDLYTPLKKRNRYDLIISNPPYEPSRLMRDLPEEFKKEPQMALDGGEDGMVLVQKIIELAPKYLKPSGLLLMEIGGLHQTLIQHYPHLPFVWLPTQDDTDCVFLLRAEDLKS